MKQKDIERHLDNLIIDGLIKEAEQDNADFEKAMRNMSDEEFIDMIYEPAYESMPCGAHSENRCSMRMPQDERPEEFRVVESENVNQPSAKQSRWKILRPWITSAIAAAAIIIMVLVPSVNAMNGKLCESALSMSNEYISASRSADVISGLNDEKLKSMLPQLEARYEECILKEGESIIYSEGLQEAGWDLAVAYLKLHKKGDATKVLKVLADQFKDTPFGDHCSKMLENL